MTITKKSPTKKAAPKTKPAAKKVAPKSKPTLRPMPSLWEHIKGPGASMEDWDEDATRMWAWKDDFPFRRLAFYGKLVGRRPTFVAPDLLECFLAVLGREDDLSDARRLYGDGHLGTVARDVLEHVAEVGPTPASELRRLFGSQGRAARVDRALEELQVSLLLTHCGIEDRGRAWPGVVYDLVGRVFPRALESGREWDLHSAQMAILERYRVRFPEVDARMVARLLGWQVSEVVACDARRGEQSVVRGPGRRRSTP